MIFDIRRIQKVIRFDYFFFQMFTIIKITNLSWVLIVSWKIFSINNSRTEHLVSSTTRHLEIYLPLTMVFDIMTCKNHDSVATVVELEWQWEQLQNAVLDSTVSCDPLFTRQYIRRKPFPFEGTSEDDVDSSSKMNSLCHLLPRRECSAGQSTRHVSIHSKRSIQDIQTADAADADFLTRTLEVNIINCSRNNP